MTFEKPTPTNFNWDGSLCPGRLKEFMTRNLPKDPLQRALKARELCFGCPNTTQCALSARNERWEGMVAGGVAIPDEGEAGHRRAVAQINTVIHHGEVLIPKSLLPKRKKTKQERRKRQPDKGVPAVEGQRACARCGVAVRSRRAKPSDFPGTVIEQARRLCKTCYNMSITDGTLEDYPLQNAPVSVMKCRHCTVLIRPQGSTLKQYPGSVIRAGRGLCSACYRNLKTEGKEDLYPPIRDSRHCTATPVVH